MNSISIKEAQRLTSPNPFALVCTGRRNGPFNLMALSWWTYVSNKPPAIAICTSQTGYSGSLLRMNGEFTLNVVGEDLRTQAFMCGRTSGRNLNKAETYAIPLVQSEKVGPMCVDRSRVCLECRVSQVVTVGDHNIWIAEVVAAHGDSSVKPLYALEGYSWLGLVDVEEESQR